MKMLGEVIAIFIISFTIMFTCNKEQVIKALEEADKKECIDGYIWKYTNSGKIKYQYLENGIPVKCIEVKEK